MKKQTSHKQTEQQLPPETVGSRTIKSFQRASQDLILKEAEAGNDEWEHHLKVKEALK